ncbi:MAG: molybdopterin molybdotransferase MoeA [Erythrobacter sp.]
MISFDEATRLLVETVDPLDCETVPLGKAPGRYLASDIVARGDAPGRPVSAMDGYAVTRASAKAGTWLDLCGETRPGMVDPGAVGEGQATRVFTGAPVPRGADLVIIQEYATRDGSRVKFAPGFGPSDHIRAAGSDFSAGTRLLAAGQRLTPQAMVAAAAADLSEVVVGRKPKIAIIATGDELVAPGETHARPGSLPESASYGVSGLSHAQGANVVFMTRGADQLDQLTKIAGEALDVADCVVVTGGASVGDHDLARPMFAGHDLQLAFSRIAIKPGKPVWLGLARGKPVLGLPGNPTSAMVTARLFLRPLLARLQGGEVAHELRFLPLPLVTGVDANGSRETFVRATISNRGLVPLGNQQSGAQAALAGADWLIRRAPDAPASKEGELVQALAF